jgi:hypothetical protein
MRRSSPNGLPYLADLIGYMDTHMLGTSNAIDEVKSDENRGTR